LRVPLKTPFETALRTVDAVEDIVVMVNTDTGHIGYGLIASDLVLIRVIRVDPRQSFFSRG
jgi:L-alanine-DL-glutamate epimerase-like enolase superfamily enzyme